MNILTDMHDHSLIDVSLIPLETIKRRRESLRHAQDQLPI